MQGGAAWYTFESGSNGHEAVYDYDNGEADSDEKNATDTSEDSYYEKRRRSLRKRYLGLMPPPINMATAADLGVEEPEPTGPIPDLPKSDSGPFRFAWRCVVTAEEETVGDGGGKYIIWGGRKNLTNVEDEDEDYGEKW